MSLHNPSTDLRVTLILLVLNCELSMENKSGEGVRQSLVLRVPELRTDEETQRTT